MRIRKNQAAKPRSLRQRLGPNESELRRGSGQTFSYRSQRSEQTSNTGRGLRADMLKPVVRTLGGFWLQRFGLGVLLVVAAYCLVSVLTLSADVKLQQLGPIERSSLFHNQTAYQSAANQLLSHSVLNSNKVTVNTAQLSKQLLADYPELASASIAVPLASHRPILYISYTEPALIIHNQSGSFVLDTTGKTLAATTPEAVTLGLPSVTDNSGGVLKLGAQVLSSDDVSFIVTVARDLRAKGVNLDEMRLPPAASQLEVTLKGQPYYIKFNLHADTPQRQVGAYLAVAKHLAEQGSTPAQYVDVRVDGRAYYL